MGSPEPKKRKSTFRVAKALLLARSDDPRAESLMRLSLAFDDSNWEAHYQLGALLADRRQFEESAKELNEAIRLNTKEAMPHSETARQAIAEAS